MAFTVSLQENFEILKKPSFLSGFPHFSRRVRTKVNELIEDVLCLIAYHR